MRQLWESRSLALGTILFLGKKAYDEIGGYRKIKFSVTEDFALFKAIAFSGKWSYRFPMDELTLVETLPVESLKEIFSQRKRWGTGGKDTGFFGFLTLATGISVSLAYHFIAVFFPCQDCALFFFLKLLMDSLFVYPTLTTLRKNCSLEIYALF